MARPKSNPEIVVSQREQVMLTVSEAELLTKFCLKSGNSRSSELRKRINFKTK